MAEQHRRGYDGDVRRRGRGWGDRDDWRSREVDDARSRSYEAGPDDLDRTRGWRDESDRYARGDESGRGYERPSSGYQEGHYGQYTGRQYGGSSYGRGYPEGDFMPNRGGSSSRASEPRHGGDWRTRGEWTNGPDERSSDEPFWGQTNRGTANGGQGYEPSNSMDRYSGSGRARPREMSRAESYGGAMRSGYGGYDSGAPWYGGGTYGNSAGYRESYVGRGPKDYKRSDDRIREDVSDRLEQDAFVDASDITVDVRDGEVTLSGTVGSRDQKRVAEDCVEAVSGVREVHNSLRVNRQDGPPSSSLLGLGGQPPRDAPPESASAESIKRQHKNTTGVTGS